jgi:hypothetical protein
MPEEIDDVKVGSPLPPAEQCGLTARQKKEQPSKILGWKDERRTR